MKFAIINKDTLEIKGQYEAEQVDNTSANRDYSLAEPICCHLAITPELVHFKADKTPIEELVTVIDVPESTQTNIIPAITHEEVITVVDIPAYVETINHGAVTHEETIDGVITVIVDVEAYDEVINHAEVSHEETITVIDTPETTEDVVIPAVTHEEEQIVSYSYALVYDADKEAAAIALGKVNLVSTKYAEMNTDIYAEMYNVFATNNPESASAYYQTWLLMKSNPALFAVDCGFNNEQEVTAFATAKLALADAYSVYRIKRINQFRAEKSAILGG